MSFHVEEEEPLIGSIQRNVSFSANVRYGASANSLSDSGSDSDSDLDLDNGPPPDRYNLAYIYMVVLGTGMLFGWNAFISEPQYFIDKYDPNIEYFFQVLFTTPNVIGVATLVRFGHRLSFKQKIFPSFIICCITLALVPVIGVVPVSKKAGMAMMMVCVFVTGSVASLFQGGLFGFAGTMPFKYTQAIMVGNGVAGVIVSLMAVVLKSIFGDHHVDTAAYIYFAMSAFIVFLSVILFWMLLRLDIVKYYIRRNASMSNLKRLASKHGMLPSSDPDLRRYDPRHELLSEHSMSHVRDVEPFVAEISHHSLSALGNADAEVDVYVAPGSSIHPLKIFKKIYPMALSVFFNFFISLSLFPSITVDIHNEDSWFPVIMITIFNVGDFIGRSSAGLKWKLPKRWVIISVLVRWGFQPLFLACLHPVFSDKWIPIVIMSVMSLTNGYLGSLCMMYGPGTVLQHEQDTAGTIMTLFLLLGIAGGSGFSFFLKFFNKNVLQ